MSKLLWEECGLCDQTGFITAMRPRLVMCGCKAKCVVESGLTVAQAEVFARELSRRDLRIMGLTKEAAEAGQEVIRLRGQLLWEGINVADAIVWWKNAAPADQLAFTDATGLRLGAGGLFMYVRPRGQQGEDNGGGG